MTARRPHNFKLLPQLAVFALLARMLVPAGYMPAQLEDGWLLQICPSGMSAAQASLLRGHHHSHDHNSEEGSQYFECALGASLGFELANWSASAFIISTAATNLEPSYDASDARPALRFRHRSRAPPLPVMT